MQIDNRITGLKFGYSFTVEALGDDARFNIPYFDTSGYTDMSYMFYECERMSTIPQLDTSNVTDMSRMFYGCNSLVSIPQLDTSNVTNMSFMFDGCNSLVSIPQLDTSNVTDMLYMFRYCRSLTSIPQLDTSNVTRMAWMFDGCNSLVSIPQLDTSNVTDMDWTFNFCYSLTDIGGFINLGMPKNFYGGGDGYGRVLALNDCDKLTRRSLLNIINNLYDRASAGYSVPTIQFPFDAYNNHLTPEDIAIATTKGWNITM
jgi:surface protein